MSLSGLDVAESLLGSRNQDVDQLASFFQKVKCNLLPFWTSEGLNADANLFWEALDLNGDPVRNRPYRFMVQARQAASLVEIVHQQHDDTDHILRSFNDSLRKFSAGDGLRGGLAFSIDSKGQIIDPIRDAYTHAFALFALAKLLRVTQSTFYRNAIDDILFFVDSFLVDNHKGGLFDRWPDPLAGKLQNPTMHLLEAYLALHEAWPERGFITRANALVELVETRMISGKPSVIREHYGKDWLPDANASGGHFFEPGHQFEWVWLLNRYSRLSGQKMRPSAFQLWQSAVEHGYDLEGFCIDAVGIGTTPSKQSRRLWPHCEAARAAIIYRNQDGIESEAVLSLALMRLNDHFLNMPFYGGWIDRFDPLGRPSIDFIPASSFYHIYGLFEELLSNQPRCSQITGEVSANA